MSDSLKTEYGFEIKEWKYKNGDDLQWALPSFNDSTWETTHIDSLDSVFKGLAWFRCKLIFDPALKNNSLSFTILQTGASELYLDGHLLKQSGTVSDNNEKEVRWDTHAIPVAFNYSPGKVHEIAVRYSNHDKEHSYTSRGKIDQGFSLRIVNTNLSFLSEITISLYTGSLCMLMTTFFLSLGLLHLLIYLFYRKNNSNLYYFFFTFILGMFPLSILITANTHSFIVSWVSNSIVVLLFPILFISLLALLNSIFFEKFLARFKWQLIAAIAVDVYFYLQGPEGDILLYLFITYFSIETLVMIIQAVRKRRKGAKIIGAGVLFFIGFVVVSLIVVTYTMLAKTNVNFAGGVSAFIIFLALFLSVISIPVSMSIYLAKDFAQTNKNLEKKLIEIE
ncbi:MAG: hypothetical protein H0X46_07595, partial [Bacteroidetes bacterium]|nr:hypothetical protein [Bacteroidota bacterium]